MAIGVFVLFVMGIYSGINIVFKIVYNSRMRILETAILSEKIEVVRNMPFESIGISGGIPSGILSHTQTVVRNGKSFDIITTVRNIDDPFDGTIGGSPNDTSPADYKLVEMSAICQGCLQTNPVILSTIVSPKGLEGASKNGALFIQVFDADGLPVVGANVHIVNNSSTPILVFDDVTGNDGWLRIVDVPTGTMTYNITVSKSGYSSDYTIAPSANNPNPLKKPSNVASQMVTEISFAIDRVGSMNINTINSTCVAISNVPFHIWGEDKKIGENPFVYKFDNNYTTNGAGIYALTNMEWDSKYNISATTSGYDISGSIPLLPVNLTPGLLQDVSLILRSHSARSLLAQVKDAGANGLPLSSSTVRLSGNGFDETKITGLGYTRQTDWSGGSGQVDFVLDDKYFVDSGTLDSSHPSGDLKLKKVGNNYLNSGWLESSTFDLGAAVNFQNLVFSPLSQPAQCGDDSISFQFATSNSSTQAVWNYLGPDGTVTTFYTATNTQIFSGYDNDRYARYKVFLNTVNTAYTPQLSEIYFTYTSSCSPPGQSFFYGMSAGNYLLEVSKEGYASASTTVDISGNESVTVNMSTM